MEDSNPNPNSVSFPPIVPLNVGGICYHTTLDTLRRDPNSMLARMFSGEIGVRKDEENRYFIDRDGKHFRHILNFLRDGSLSLSEEALKEIKPELQAEARFFQLERLEHFLVEQETMEEGQSSRQRDQSTGVASLVIVCPFSVSHNATLHTSHPSLQPNNINEMSAISKGVSPIGDRFFVTNRASLISDLSKLNWKLKNVLSEKEGVAYYFVRSLSTCGKMPELSVNKK